MSSSTPKTAGRANTVGVLPLTVLPCTTTVVTGYPTGKTPPSPSPPPPPRTYPHQFFLRHNQQLRTEQLLREHRRRATLYRLIAGALLVFIVMGCLLSSVWLFVRPRLPQVHLASVTFSPLSTTATGVSAACNVSLLLNNTNRKFTVFYDNLELFVDYQPPKVPLFTVQVPPFAQPQKSVALVHTHMEISNVSVGNDVVKGLKGDLVRGSVSFGVKVFALLRLENKDWRTRSHLITVQCINVIVGFSSVNGQGTLLNPYKDCQVALSKNAK